MSRIRADQITNSSASGPPTVTNGLVVNNGLNVTGIITGNVIGNVTGNVTGNITGNVTGNINGSITVGENLNVTGVTTTSNLVVENSAYNAISTTNTNKTIVNREYCTVVTSTASTNANITVTLPISPQVGWEVGVAVGGTFLDTVIARNGSKIMGLSEDMTLNKEYIAIQLVYIDAYVGWRFF
jgi:hypothetical protein